jgi:hypothetical protein
MQEIKSPFFEKYFQEVLDRLAMVTDIQSINIDKLRAHCLSKYQDRDLTLNNNAKNIEMSATMGDLLKMTLCSKQKPIVSGFNTLFKNSNQALNVPGKFLDYLLKERKVAKNEMFKHINDADQAIHDSLHQKQQNLKVLANSYYGAFGTKSFIFFNPYLGPSVTYTGQLIIISAILGFEGFLSGNYYFENFGELFYFLTNIRREEYDEEMILDELPEITSEMLIEKYKEKCQFDLTENQLQVLELFFTDLPVTVMQKFYLKNDFFGLLNLPSLKEFVKDNFIRNDFPDVNAPPEEIKDELEYFNELFEYFVYYPYPYPNKSEKVSKLIRKTVIISDTDSTFLNLNPYFEYVLDIGGIEKEDVTKEQQASIISVMTFVITKFIARVFWQLTKNLNILEEDRSKINMKSEFHYLRMMLTRNKKSYAGLVLSKEGNIYDEPDVDIKGIQIKKTTTPRPARKFFTDILEDDILKAKTLNGIGVYRRFIEFENQIRKDVENSNTAFLTPAVIKNFSNYANLYSMQSYRGLLVWNALFPDNQINENSSMHILTLKKVSSEELYEYLPEDACKKIEALFEQHGEDLSKHGLGLISIPFGVKKIPDMFIPLIDTDFIINRTMSSGNIILDSLGFTIVKSKKYETPTNIIAI